MSFLVPQDISFLHPQMAWVLLGLPLVWLTARRSRLVQKFLRSAVFACLVLALTQPSWVHRATGQRRVLVIERDAWLATRATPAGRAMEDRLLADALKDDARPILIETGTGPSILAAQPKLAPVLADHVLLDGSVVSAALDEALARIPEGTTGSVLLAATGHAARSEWAHAVDGFVKRQIPVNTVSLNARDQDAYVVDVLADPVRVGEVAHLHALVSGDSRGHTVRLAIFAGEARLALSVPFTVSGDTPVDLTYPADRAGFLPYRAVLVDAAGVPFADRGGMLEGVLAVQDPVRVLYLGGREQKAASHLQQLMGRTVQLDPRDPAHVASGASLSDWQAVMLDDLPASRLPSPFQQDLLHSVSAAGTGLFYAGGAGAFSTGGYAGTPLAGALPLTLQQDEKLERPSVALVVVIDTSGSMAGEPIDLAKQVARFAVGKLTPQDQVGVVEFYGAKQWSVPLQPASDVAGVERAIARMQAQGSSILYPAIQEAYYALKGSSARFKHILVISDAGVEEQRYQQLLTQAAQDRITVSTALVGNDPEGEERMAEWARWGHGRYYAVPDSFSLVDIDLKQPQVKPSPAWRQGSFATAAGEAALPWQSVAMTGIPAVDGYVPVGERTGAQTLLRVGGQAPLLTTWQYGNGRITALMTTPTGDGTRGWSGWRGYGAWLAKLVTRTADQSPQGELTLRRTAGSVLISLQTNSRSENAVRPGVFVSTKPGEAGRAVPMEERAPGIFTGKVEIAPISPVLIEARLGGVVLRAADRGHGAADAPVRLPLEDLANVTSGVFPADAEPGHLPRWLDGREIAATDLSRWCALIALCLYLAEITLRRWPARRRPS